MTKSKDEKSPLAIGARLRLTREALGLTQVEFARRADVTNNAYNQYEKGKQRPSLDAAIALREAYSLTLDWIYLGDNSGLKYELVEAMKKLALLRQPAG